MARRIWAAFLAVACAHPSASAPADPVDAIVRSDVEVATMPPPPDDPADAPDPHRPTPPEPESLVGTPPPISGGTLLYTRSGWLIAGDELTDRLYVIDPERPSVVREIQFAPGSMPGRMAEDRDGVVHVVLREAGAVARVDPLDGVLDRSEPCASPSGIAWDGERDRLLIACAGGALVALGADHVELRRWTLDPDLRDVVAQPGRVFVSRLRSAELLVLDGDGHELARVTPPSEEFDTITPPAVMVPRVAWRLRASRWGGVLMAHQHQVATDLGPLTVTSRTGGTTYYTATARPGLPTAILEHRLTRFDHDGAVLETMRTLPNGGLLVDAADWSESVIGAYAASRVDPPGVATEPLGDDRFAMQYQDHQLLVGIHGPDDGDAYVLRPARLELDHGHRTFHAGTSAGIACASCHPGGHEDGHTWITPESGVRRSQSLLGGLRGTEPFHWGGDLGDFDDLMDAQATRLFRTFSEADRESTLDWLDRLPNPPPIAEATLAGEAAFASAGCTDCHSGPRRSDELNHDVGAGAVQTPRLGGVAYRAPFFHDGCAPTLEATLDGACREVDAHGVADPALRAQLVRYLTAL